MNVARMIENTDVDFGLGIFQVKFKLFRKIEFVSAMGCMAVLCCSFEADKASLFLH